MKTKIFSAAYMIGFLIALAGMSKVQAANKLSTAEIAAGGWQLLFDGTKVDQWTVDNANKWVIDDSGMKSPNTGVMLYSTKTFDNFEWRVDFKVNSGGNSGFFIRTKDKDWYCDGFEISVLDSKSGGDNGVDGQNRSDTANHDKMPSSTIDPATGKPFVIGGTVPIKRSGTIYDMYPTTKDGILIKNGGVWVDRMRPAMVWNTMVIWANGKNIETWLNGMKVTDIVIGSTEYQNRYKQSKFYPGCGDFGNKNTTGKLVVQDHGGGLDVWMKNVKIRPLNTSEALPKPLVSPDGGSISSTTKVTLDAGITAYVRYTLDGTEPTESSPLYNDSTGLLINQSGTVSLKAKTFRSGFPSSSTTTVSFTLPGTGVLSKAIRAVPEIDFQRLGSQLTIQNLNGVPFIIEIIQVNGNRSYSTLVDKSSVSISLRGLQSGIHLVKMRTKDWIKTSKLLID